MHDYNFTVRRGKRSSNSFTYAAFLVFLIIAIVVVIKLRNQPASNPSPNPDQIIIQEIPQPTNPDHPTIQQPNLPPIKSFTELASTIKSLIDEKSGSYSVYFEDLSTGRKMGINETMIVTAASVNKIPILASVYSLANDGKLDLDRKITIQAADIQDYGTGSIRYEGPGGVYSIKSLARLMMEKSDNTAAYVLASEIVGLDRIQEIVNGWGLKQTDMVNNKTSNSDMALLLKKMRVGEIANEALTTEMIGFMDDSDFEDRLPQLLPKDITIYHKIGTEVGNIHDVGIVELPNKPYYIGVLTSDITNEDEAVQTIAQISKLVFDYQKKQ